MGFERWHCRAKFYDENSLRIQLSSNNISGLPTTFEPVMPLCTDDGLVDIDPGMYSIYFTLFMCVGNKNNYKNSQMETGIASGSIALLIRRKRLFFVNN